MTGIDLISANTVVLNYVLINTSTYTATASNYFIGLDSISAGSPVTITLPDVNTLTKGQVLVFKDEVGGVTANGITISQNGTELIDNAPSYNFSTDYESLNLYWNSSKWLIF